MSLLPRFRMYLSPPDDSPYPAAGPAPAPPAPPQPPAAPEPPAPTPAPADLNGNPPAPAAPASAEAIQSAIQVALAPVQTELTALREENAALRAAAEPPAAPVPAGDDDFTQTLLNDPKGAVTGVVKEVVSGIAPLLNELAGTAQEAILEGHRGAIDTEFGTGTFHEEFMPVLQSRFDTARKENPSLLTSREWINSEINGIKGFKMNNLVERRGKAATARTETERAEAERLISQLNATNLTGGTRPATERPREPTPAEQEYLDSLAKGGQSKNLETLRKSQDSGSTLSGMRETFKKEGE